jgi:high affinity sulfate transporter 1
VKWGIAPSFSGFQRASIPRDAVAGLTVWAVLVPESLAYATIAGVPPVVGLYAAVPALALYALMGTSRQLVVSPMSATAALSIGVVAEVSSNPKDVVGLTAALALATGIVAILAGLMRLGFLASFISEPVLKGFIIGLALTILIGQVPDLLGVSKGSGNFVEKTAHVVSHLNELDGLTTAVGLLSLGALLVLRRFLPLLPGSLVVALLGILATQVLSLQDHGLEIVGHIDPGLPSVGLPDISWSTFPALLGGSVGLMLVGFAEGLGAAKIYAAKEGYDVDPNHELLGLGVSNLGSGLASGMVVNGSLSKTAVNGSAGARSQLSGLTAALLTLVTLLFLTGLFEKLPEATLAAIVIAAVVELVDISSLRRLWKVTSGRVVRTYQLTARADFVAAAAALLGVLLFDTLPGLAIGIAVSLILLIARTSRPHIAPLAPVNDTPGAPWVDIARSGLTAPDGVLVVRVEAPLMFANADSVRSRVRELAGAAAAGPGGLRLVVLDGSTSPSIDVTAAEMLTQLRSDVGRLGGELVLAGNVGQVRDVLATAEETGEPMMYATLDEALASVPERAAGSGPELSPGTGEPPDAVAPTP